MASHSTAGEDQEALYQSSPCALYFVQSPSTASHANSHPSESTFLSPFVHETACSFSDNRGRDKASRFSLSHYSSSRGSNNSFVPEKKVGYGDIQCNGSGGMKRGERQRLRIIGVNEDGEDGGDGGVEEKKGFWRFLAVDPSSSCCCIMFQVTWRLMVSMLMALLVFFLATKPPQPKVSFKIGSIKQFSLREGLDNTGVVTKILTSNCSMVMKIDNYSKVFGLHIHSSTLEMAFGNLKFASSQGGKSYVESESSLIKVLYVGTESKPMYGAGQSMQEMLESGQGLPLEIRLSSSSSYHVVWNLVRSNYHHHAECLVLVLSSALDKQDHIGVFNSTCTISNSHA